jgi:tetratricopeptide (TPR) repeat protein
LTELFANADADVVQSAVAATQSLADVDACRELWEIPSRNALPDDPDARDKVDAVLAEVDRSAAQVTGGRYDEALLTAEAAQQQADALGHAPTRCASLLAVAIAQEKTRKLQESRATLESAVLCASDATDAKTEARAWSHLIYVLGRELHEHEVALALQLPADAAARRAGGDEASRANTAMYVAVTLSEQGRFDEAVKAGEEAVRLLEQVHGEQHPYTANGRGALGAILGRAGKNAEAKKHLRLALESFRTVLGDNHPDVAISALNLGNVLKNENDLAGARELYELALQIREDSGEDELKVAQVHAQLGQVQDALGEHEPAKSSLQKALAILESHPQAPPRHLVAALNNLGLALLRGGDAAGALGHFERAAALVDTLDEQPQNARTVYNVCEALVALERRAEAKETCTEALAMIERLEPGSASAETARATVAKLKAPDAAESPDHRTRPR